MSHRTPEQLKILNGNPGHRAINRQYPQYETAVQQPPGFVNETGRELWFKLLPLFLKQGILTEAMYPAFTALCNSWGRYCDIEKRMSTVEDPKDRQQVRLESTKYFNDFKFMLQEFGLTPATLSKIKIDDPKENELEEFINNA